MTVYPYRQPNGYRSILEAVDRADARQWLLDCAGHGVQFCEVEMDESNLYQNCIAPDSNDRIDALLAQHENHLT